ncbi:MAG: hypothetical protein FRX49_06282 [Trebouxia sp. A1-2]|nr:MAG: hypothetical protein FRX49_06282 [Trebouxia sp. A1-2]
MTQTERQQAPDTLQEDALRRALTDVYDRHPGCAVLIGVNQQIPDLILVHLHKVHLPSQPSQVALDCCMAAKMDLMERGMMPVASPLPETSFTEAAVPIV